MTDDKNFKRLIRARMQRSGESYTTARANLLARQRQPATPSTAGALLREDLAVLMEVAHPSTRDGRLVLLNTLLEQRENLSMLEFFAGDAERIGRDADDLISVHNSQVRWSDSKESILHWATLEAEARGTEMIGPTDVLLGLALSFVEVLEILSLHHIDVARLRRYSADPPDDDARRLADAARSVILSCLGTRLGGRSDLDVVVDVWSEPFIIDIYSPRDVAYRIVERGGTGIDRLEQELFSATGRRFNVFLHPEKS